MEKEWEGQRERKQEGIYRKKGMIREGDRERGSDNQ